jgi:DinB superfamily
MISSQDLSNAFARNVSIIKMQTEGLTHEDSLRQLPFHGNCLNWVLGHIAVNRDSVLETLGEPPVMDAYGVRYKRGSDRMTQADEGTLALEELLNWLDRSQERIATALSKMDEAALAREYASGDRKTTVGQRAFFLYFHETFHVGQTELFRQLAGKDDKII